MQDNGGRPLAAVFAAPGKYIQGAGAVGRIGEVLDQLGSTRPLILGDPIVGEIMGDSLDDISGRHARRVRRRVLARGDRPRCRSRLGERRRRAGRNRRWEDHGHGQGRRPSGRAVARHSARPSPPPTHRRARSRSSTTRRAPSRSTASSARTRPRSSWTPPSSPARRCASWWPGSGTASAPTSRPTPPRAPAKRPWPAVRPR